MTENLHSISSAAVVTTPSRGRMNSLTRSSMAKLLTATMAAVSACSITDGSDGVSPTISSYNGGDTQDGIIRSFNMSVDATAAVSDIADDATPAVANDSSDDSGVEMAGEITDTCPDATDSTDSAVTDATVSAEINGDVANNTNETVASETITATDSTAGGDSNKETTGDASQPTVETTKPSSPKEICEDKKAQIIATLKSGEPECSGFIPGAGKISGKLVCEGANTEPNCSMN